MLNGPNLNLLGVREPELYGRDSLEDLERAVRSKAETVDVTIAWHQTNHEGEFVELVQGLRGEVDGAIVNAAAFTHTSFAIRDAWLSVEIPFVEVHLSNIFAREPERRRSLLADIAVGVVAGFGGYGYLLALDALINHLELRGS
ncbi:MAG: type II 3-dehydroquinate dehydratase [Acidobacteria bacterium]|nr:type II 3-dehydroquinate dehydratase [Acidobacteriota bacterium]